MARLRRNRLAALAGSLLTIAALSVGGHAAAAPVVSGSAPSAVCELHVWGAVPTYKPGTFAGPGARVGSADADRADPVANINVFDPLVRLRGVDDRWLAPLSGSAGQVRIVRHPAAIDIRLAKGSRRRLAESGAACYADFILLELYDVGEAPDPDGYRGLLVETLMARAGFHATYLINRYGPGPAPLERIRDTQITPLGIARPHWSDDPAATVEALDAAIVAGIARLGARQRSAGK